MSEGMPEKDGKRKARMPWFKMYPEAWLDATRDLSEVERAHYFDCLCLMYKWDGPLRDDDEWIAHQLHTKIGKWKASRRRLIACGKLIETDVGLINPRAAEELNERITQRSKKAQAAAERERKKRDEPEFPFENNKGRAQLCLVSGTDGAQKGLHARAHHQIIEEEKKEKGGAFSEAPLIDDDPYRRRDELSPAIIANLEAKAGDAEASRLLRVYFRSTYARDARSIDDAFCGWLTSKGLKLNEEMSAGELQAAIRELCTGADGKVNTALPKTVRGLQPLRKKEEAA